MSDFTVKKGKLAPLGAMVTNNGIQFTTPLLSANESGVVLISKKNQLKYKISFSEGIRTGNIASLLVEGINPDEFDYMYYDGDEEYVDPYARQIIGNETWGLKEKDTYSLRGGLISTEFDWGYDQSLCTPFEESIIYLLHVRGFTAHKSSKVNGKGTFKGIMEKIPYLKELGITAVELLPAYEFEEYELPDEKLNVLNEVVTNKADEKINYWGFKKGFYFAPKSSYAKSSDPSYEMKEMIKALHENGIEVIMQFYFPDSVKQGFIYDVVRYWILEYHIDGVHLKGSNIPITLIGTEPLFANTKIFYDYIPIEQIYHGFEMPAYCNLCVYSDDYMYNIRKFLKGDEDQLKDFIRIYNKKSERSGNVNFVTNYYGFTLNDLVSYDKKHNEENGEGNCDGSNYNYSWNCGIEGKTRKTQIVALRKRMMKNAIATLLLSQGTPVLTAGDELCNSQNGNNNPYCQDNEVTWINWSINKGNQEILDFTKKMIAFRKQQHFLNQKEAFTLLDRNRLGYPDLSYHGEEAYKADFATYNRHIGIMYADTSKENSKVPELTYIAFNMYWENKKFALPNLPKNQIWKCILSTGEVLELEDKEEKFVFEVKERSVAVFKSCIK